MWARPEPTRLAIDSSFSCETPTRVLIYTIDTGTAVATDTVTFIDIWNQRRWALTYYTFLCLPTYLTLNPVKSSPTALASETVFGYSFGTGSPVETWFRSTVINVWNIRVFTFQFWMLGIFWMKTRCSSSQWVSQRQIFVVFSRGMLSPLNA